MSTELATQEPSVREARTVWEKRLPAPQQEQDSPFILPSETKQNTKIHHAKIKRSF